MKSHINTKERAHVTYDEIDTLKPTSRKRNWKPFAIKLPFLASTALLCLICIILLEVMVRRSTLLDKSLLEVSENLKRSVEIPPVADGIVREHARSIAALVEDVSSNSITPSSAQTITSLSTQSPSALSAESDTSSSTSEEIPPVTSTSAFFQPPPSKTVELTSLDVVTGEIIESSMPTSVMSTPGSPNPASSCPPSSKCPSASVGFQLTSLTNKPIASATSNDGQRASTEVPTTARQLRVTELLVSTTISGSLVVLTSSITVSVPQTVGTTPTAARGSAARPTVSRESGSISDVKPFTITSVFTSDGGHIVTSTMVVQPSIMVSVFTAGDGHLTSSTAVIHPLTMVSVFTADNGQLTTSTVIFQPSTTSRIGQTSNTSIPQQITDPMKPSLLLAGDIKTASYFACLYVPSIIAITIKEAWAVTASGLKLMQPFYRLNRPEGASARKSLMADYVSGTDSIYSITSALKGDTSMLGIVMVNIIMNLLAPLSTKAMTIIPTLISFDEHGNRHVTNPVWVLNQFFVRALQTALSIAVFLIVLVAIIDYKRRSGLSANPSSIATMASLCNHPNMVHDLHQIDPNVSDKEIEVSVAHNHYKVTNYQDLHGSNCYGLVKAEEVTPQETHILPPEDTDHLTSGPKGTTEMSAEGVREHNQIERAVWYRLVDGLLILLITSLLAVIIAYYVDGTQSGFNRFFNSKRFGPSFILSLGASVTTTTFQSIEREVRLLTPYRRLTAGNASPDTILRSVNGTAVSSLFQSIRYGSFAFFVASVTVLGNVLIVAVAGIPFNTSMTDGSYKVCTFLSLTLIGLMLIAAIAVFFWRRQNKKMKIPLEPNRSLIRVWMSLSNPGNHLRALLSESEDKSGTSLRALVNEDDGRYWAGWICDDYGRNVWCVDKEHARIRTDHDGMTLPRGGISFSNPYLKPNIRWSRFSWRGDTMQKLPFIRTEDCEERMHQRDHFEQDPRPAQTRRRDDSTNHVGGSAFLHPDSTMHYEGSDISDGEDMGQAHSHVRIDRCKNSRGLMGTETVRLL